PQTSTAMAQAGGGGAAAGIGARPVGGGGAAAPAGGGDLSAGGQGALGGGGAGVVPNIRITPDLVNNSILVYASQDTQRIVEQTLRQIARPLMQVAIDATVAEVTLNDTLTYGVQYFLQKNSFGLVSSIGSAALSSVLPGFNLV